MDNNNIVPGVQPQPTAPQPQPIAPQPTAPQPQPTPMVQPQPAMPQTQPVAPVQPIAPAQPVAQPITPAQPVAQPQGAFGSAASVAPATMPVGGAKKSKAPLIIGLSAGLAAIIIGVVLFLVLSKSGGITVICNSSDSLMGITMDSEARAVVKDQEVVDISVAMTVDLNSLSDMYKSYESELVDGIKSLVDVPTGCFVENDYVPGDHFKMTVKPSNGNVSPCFGPSTVSFKGKTAQELANAMEAVFKDLNSDAVCTQK